MAQDVDASDPPESAEMPSARAQLVEAFRVRVLWSMGLTVGGMMLLWILAPRVTIARTLAWLVFITCLTHLYNLYRLSMAAHPERSVAWTVVLLQVLPPIGLIVTLSLLWKARSIARPVWQAKSPSRQADPERHGVTRRRHQ